MPLPAGADTTATRPELLSSPKSPRRGMTPAGGPATPDQLAGTVPSLTGSPSPYFLSALGRQGAITRRYDARSPRAARGLAVPQETKWNWSLP